MTNAPFSNFIEGQTSLYQWITQHSPEGYIDEELQDEFPDVESKTLAWDTFDGINVAPGFFEGVIGSESDDATDKATVLFELFTDLGKENNEINEQQLDKKLGAIYTFLVENSTITYIDSFIDLLSERSEEVSFGLIYKIAKIFLTEAVHREPIKWAIAFIGLLKLDEEDIDLIALFGLTEEFSKFAAVALYRQDQNELLFELAKKVHGWGRVTYIGYLKCEHESIQKWILLEGYKCSIGVNHTAYECAVKGNLLGYIQTYGWSDELYEAAGDLLLGMIDHGPGERIVSSAELK